MKKLSHINSKGKAEMVDVSEKEISTRTAEAYAEVKVSKEVFNAIKNNSVKKGDVLSIAKFAGIQAAKKTSELIPLCHNIFISKIDVELKLNPQKKIVEIKSFAKTSAQTGIEMEALTAVSVAALTVYDMCKAIDKSMIISEVKLLSKTGGKSGSYIRKKIERRYRRLSRLTQIKQSALIRSIRVISACHYVVLLRLEGLLRFPSVRKREYQRQMFNQQN